MTWRRFDRIVNSTGEAKPGLVNSDHYAQALEGPGFVSLVPGNVKLIGATLDDVEGWLTGEPSAVWWGGAGDGGA